MKILVTGNKSGLGRYLFENSKEIGGEGIGWDRDISAEARNKIKKEGVDIIIHCAFNSSREVTSESLFPYIEDNILLTKELAEIPHKKFILFSSIDVYPKDGKPHSEQEAINMNEVEGIYGITKLISESIIREKCPEKFLIIRGSAFLGKYSRENSQDRIERGETITLSGKSEFRYIQYDYVLKFVEKAIKDDLKGIYNFTPKDKITLYEAAEKRGKSVSFGSYVYVTGLADNSKIHAVFPDLEKMPSQEEIIDQFIKERKKGE